MDIIHGGYRVKQFLNSIIIKLFLAAGVIRGKVQKVKPKNQLKTN
jgi:hypothetical protein